VQENTANPKFNGKPWRRLYIDVDTSRLPAADQSSDTAAKLMAWRTLMNDVLPRRNPDQSSTVEAGPGAVLLHARDAKVHGTSCATRPSLTRTRWASGPRKTIGSTGSSRWRPPARSRSNCCKAAARAAAVPRSR